MWGELNCEKHLYSFVEGWGGGGTSFLKAAVTFVFAWRGVGLNWLVLGVEWEGVCVCVQVCVISGGG